MGTVKHGTAAGYVAGCRQECCRSARRAYNQHKRRQIAYGRWNPWGDIDAVRTHIARLRASGMTQARIAAAARIASSHVSNIARGTGAVSRQTAEAILAVRAAQEVDAGYVPAELVRRRIQALACLGWGAPDLARESGVSARGLWYVRKRTWVQAAVYRKVAAAYDRMSMTVAPESQYTTRIRARAASLSWLPPLAWDDSLIDLVGDDLTEEVARQVAAMDDTDLPRCWAAYRDGERSPVIVGAAREYRRRSDQRRSPRRHTTAA